MTRSEKIHYQEKLDTIDRLTAQIDKLKFEVLETRVMIDELDSYLRSPKFYQDTTVQVSDILLRLAETKAILGRI